MSDVGDTRVGIFSDSCMSGGEDLEDTDAEFSRGQSRKSLSLKGKQLQDTYNPSAVVICDLGVSEGRAVIKHTG